MRSPRRILTIPGNIFANLLWSHREIVPHDLGLLSLSFANSNLDAYVMPVLSLEIFLEL